MFSQKIVCVCSLLRAKHPRFSISSITVQLVTAHSTEGRCYFLRFVLSHKNRAMRSKSYIYIGRLPSHTVDRVIYLYCLKRDIYPVIQMFLDGRNICVEV
jgi:hypothetical protein